MKKIILDTNFLLIPGALKVDIFAEIERICLFKYKLYILDKTIDELEKLQETGKGKTSRNAKFALELIKQKKVQILPTKNYLPITHTDDLILKKADKDTIVATQDAALKRCLKEARIPTIVLKSKKYLGIVHI